MSVRFLDGLTLAARHSKIKMDTDDLSKETYQGILIEAEKFNHNLTLHFGLLSYECKDEHEFIIKAEKLIKAIKKADEADLSDLFFGEVPDSKKLKKTLDKILSNIVKINQIPIEKRHFDF